MSALYENISRVLSGKSMKAVMYGAGNIGRGFIGRLFNEAGYEVCFIDVNDEVIRELNSRRRYPVRVISNEGYVDEWVQNVCAIDGKDKESAANAIAQADIMATAVGVRVLSLIAPIIAKGLSERFKRNESPLNIIICENLLNADEFLRENIKKHLSQSDQAVFDEKVGLVEASIGRMVPIQTEQMKQGDPLRVCVERYGFLPVDKSAFVGELPPVKALVPYSPFAYYIKRKLFVHNTGHVICAYLGAYAGEEYIYGAVENPAIRLIAQNAMLESALSLSLTYDIPMKDLTAHIDDLLTRFSNRALQDTCHRVGFDVQRKLGEHDRLVGAALFAIENGIKPVYIAAGIASALYKETANRAVKQSNDTAKKILHEYSRIDDEHELYPMVMGAYDMLCAGEPLESLVGQLGQSKSGRDGTII